MGKAFSLLIDYLDKLSEDALLRIMMYYYEILKKSSKWRTIRSYLEKKLIWRNFKLFFERIFFTCQLKQLIKWTVSLHDFSPNIFVLREILRYQDYFLCKALPHWQHWFVGVSQRIGELSEGATHLFIPKINISAWKGPKTECGNCCEYRN